METGTQLHCLSLKTKTLRACPAALLSGFFRHGLLILICSGYLSRAQTWVPMGPYHIPTDTFFNCSLGILRDIGFHPANSNIFWVGGSGGVWKTTDNAATWLCLTDAVGVKEARSIAVNPADPDSIFFVAGSSLQNQNALNLFFTADGGATWQVNSLNAIPNLWFISSVFISASDRNVVFANTNLGVYRSDDQGSTWTLKQPGFFRTCFQSPAAPQLIYASQWGSGAAFYRSTDHGNTWAQSYTFTNTSVDRIEFATTPADPNLIHAVASNYSGGLEGLYKSTDAGLTFTQYLAGNCSNNLLGYDTSFQLCGGQAVHDLTIMIDQMNASDIYLGGIFTTKSQDGGATWTVSNEPKLRGVHYDQQMIKTNPLTGEIFELNDGGIYRTIDKGATWTNASANLNNLQIRRIAVPRHSASEAVIIGQQDNGNKFLTAAGIWKDGIEGDGESCAYDPGNSQVFYISLQYGLILKTIDAGATFSVVSPSGAGQPFQTNFVMDPRDPNTLFYAGSSIYTTTNGASSWTTLPSSPPGNLFVNVAYAGNTRHIFSTGFSDISRSTDNGATWTSIANPTVTGNTVNGIAVKTGDPNTIWAITFNYTPGQKVFKTTDGGTTWTNISDNLPNTRINCVLYQDSAQDRIYIGTDIGVFYRDNTMSAWLPYHTGLPVVAVQDLAINYGNQTIYAGTYGRGLWKSNCTGIASTTGFKEHYKLSTAAIYPNPSNGNYTISYHLSHEQSEFLLYDVLGRTVFSQTLAGMEGDQRVNCANLNTGVYYYTIRSGDRLLHTGKISIVK